ncbi:glycoside hydrolase family 30 protein [Eudoraea sp.]|uniref:glycoside hydrolase family 30 protein n=1 Tax=Eudoraea sp. TaxID=1979955 RepID=UPI003C7611C0
MSKPYYLKTLFISSLSLLILSSCNSAAEKKAIAKLYVTTLDKGKLLEESPVYLDEQASMNSNIISVDPTKTYQEMDGFGYTLTGGSALHMHNMSPSARQKLIQELFGFGKEDIGVSYLRVSIGASDLDEKLWSYNDLPEGETDMELSKFSLAYDTLYLVPVIKEILKISPNIKIMGSPWSPPKWMKDNEDTRGGSLEEEYYEVYAQYFVKYIKAMKENGIEIDAVTVQNEPLHPGNNPSLLMLAAQQAVFVRDHLGPAFEKNNIKTKIIIYDHNADRPDYPISILNDSIAAKYIDGSAFHLYGGKIEALSEVHEAHPDKNLYFTEQWIGAPGDFAGDLSWHTENLIIGASRNWCKTVLEWNLAADENQEPHTDRGGCVGCLGAITINGDKVTRNPSYYIIAQASKFVPPGSVRVASTIEGNIPNVAFKTPEAKVVIILQNKNEEDSTFSVKIENKSIIVTLKSGAVGSLII